MKAPSSGPTEEREPLRTIRKLQSERFSRYFLLLLLFSLTVLFFNMIKIFLIPVLMAAVFATLFYPLYLKVLRPIPQRRGLAAFFSCLILLLGLLLPLILLGNIVTHQAVAFYTSAEEKVREIVMKGESGPLGRIKNSPFVHRFYLDRLDWQAITADFAKATGSFLANIIKKTSGGAIYIIANIFITLFTIFYFFRDGEILRKRIRMLFPLSDEYEDALIARFVSVSRATLKGTVVIGLAQSTTGALTLWIFGVESPALWFVVMLILSMIPLVGAWLVMHPAAIIQILIGNIWQGIGILVVTIVIISSIDNVLRPRLV